MLRCQPKCKLKIMNRDGNIVIGFSITYNHYKYGKPLALRHFVKNLLLKNKVQLVLHQEVEELKKKTEATKARGQRRLREFEELKK